MSKNVLAALVVLAMAHGGVERVRAGDPQQHGEKIEFSEAPASSSPVVVSNLNKLAPSESSFKQVKEDLLRPFSSLDPRNSLQMQDFANAPLPQQRPVQGTMSRHMQEMLDKKRNWAFTSYEELFSPASEEEIFGIKQYGQDGREKKAETVMEKYYDSLDQKNGYATNSQTAAEARAEFINRNGFDPLGNHYEPSESFMRDSFRPEAPDSVVDKTEGTGLLGGTGLPATTLGSPQEVKMQQRRLDDIRRSILGDAAVRLPRPGEENSALLTANDYYAPKIKAATAQNLLNQQAADGADLREKSANPFIVADPTANVLHSHINDDLTARALGLPTQSMVRTNSVTRPAVTLQSITAEWDPFGANRPRPKF